MPRNVFAFVLMPVLAVGLASARPAWGQEKEEPGEARRLEGHGGDVWAIAVSPDGRHVVTGSHDNTLALWNLEKGQRVRGLEGHTEAIWSVAVSPDGRRALSGGHDGTVRLWDLDSGKEIAKFEPNDG